MSELTLEIVLGSIFGKDLATLTQQGMRGLVMDFRFNPGGLLNAAVDMCDMFLQEGVIVSTKGRSVRTREQKWTAHSDTLISPNMPMVVLVNEYSASASEISQELGYTQG